LLLVINIIIALNAAQERFKIVLLYYSF